MATTKLTTTIIEAAIYGFEEQKKSIDAQIAELRAMMTGAPKPAPLAKEASTKQKKRKFSAEAKKRMREAQRKRWAKIKGATPTAATGTAAKTPKTKRKLTAAGRKAISAAMKKRWAAKKAAAA